MKKLDQLLISSFIPPFMVTFMIAIFVLLMQILWLYIDDIAGKGLGLFILIELLAYKCVSLVPSYSGKSKDHFKKPNFSKIC